MTPKNVRLISIQSFNKYLHAYYIKDIVLCDRYIAVNKTDMNLLRVMGKTDNKQMKNM